MRGVLATAIVCAFGCATSGVHGGAAGPTAVLRIIGGGDFGFSLAGNHAVGPQVDLSWDDHSMHGMLGGQLIRLEVEGNRVFGRGALGNLSLVSTLDGDTLDVS